MTQETNYTCDNCKGSYDGDAVDSDLLTVLEDLGINQDICSWRCLYYLGNRIKRNRDYDEFYMDLKEHIDDLVELTVPKASAVSKNYVRNTIIHNLTSDLKKELKGQKE